MIGFNQMKGKNGGKTLILILSLILLVSMLLPNTFAAGLTEKDAQDQKNPEYIPGEYIVKYSNNTGIMSTSGVTSTNKILTSYKAEIEEISTDGIALVSVDEQMTEAQEKQFVDDLEKSASIEYVEKNYIVKALKEEIDIERFNDSYSGNQWALENVRATEAWNLFPGDGGAKVRVAVIDTGVDSTHPDLAGKVISGFTAIEKNSSGQIYDPKDTGDDHGHGTHVSGIIAAVCDNEIGMQGVSGIADIEILPVKVLDDRGSGTNYDVVRGIRYAADNGASILNLSLGSNFYSQAEAEAVYYAQQKGCLVIAAAGNDGTDVRGQYPASLENVISVGATDRNNERAYFSNYGDTLDISAPGVAILSCVPKATAIKDKANGEVVYGNDKDGYYEEWSGTSMACPYVVGVAALYKTANSLASPLDLEGQLFNTVNDIGDLGRDTDTGRGLIDAAAVMGMEAVNKALLISYPTQNKELFEETSLRVQISTSKGIDKVAFYLDEIAEEKQVAQVSCNTTESFYNCKWDTKTVSDGKYELIAVAYDTEGKQVGESQQISISILNSITNGFTLNITDPAGNPASSAEVTVLGKSDSGYKKLFSTYTTELGYARIKGLDTIDSEYEVVINGSYSTTDDKIKSYYVYNEGVPELGGIYHIDGSDARETTISITGENGSVLPDPYIRLTIRDDQGEQLSTLPAWKVNSLSKLHVTDGIYDLMGYWTPTVSADEGKPSYYMTKSNQVISNDNTNLTLNCNDSVAVSAKFNSETGSIDGTFSLKGVAESNTTIPFLNGIIRGSKIYVTPGTYSVSAQVEAVQGDKNWSFELSKSEPVVVESPITIDFGADIGITQFKADMGLIKEGDVYYLNRGDTLRTVNDFGDKYGNIIENMGFNYPQFTIYNMDSETPTIVYQRKDCFQSDSSYWDSDHDYEGNVLPQIGNYRAELSFDAGPFGGISKKTIDFTIREKDGQTKTDINIKRGENTIVPNAYLTVYYWQTGENSGWVKSGQTFKADSEGKLKIPNNIELSPDGINLAVVSQTQLKEGYQLPYTKGGFAVFPFKELSELAVLDLLNDTVAVNVKVNDANGNAVSGLNTSVYFPVYSDGGGKLANCQPVDDVRVNVKQSYGEYTVYIPEGSYPYVYSTFNYVNKEYFLLNRDIKVQNNTEIILDGRITESISVVIPEGFKGERLCPNPEGLDILGFEGHDLTLGNTYYWTKGTYKPTVAMQNVAGDTKLTVALGQEKIELNKAENITIGNEFIPDISLNQKNIVESEPMKGSVSFLDENGNQLMGVRKLEGDGFVPYYPTLVVGTSIEDEKEIAGNGSIGFNSIMIPADFYSGNGTHYAYLKYQIDGIQKESEKVWFMVGEGGESEALAAAKTAVETAEASKLQVDVNVAQALVTALPDGEEKTALQDRINAVQDAINAANRPSIPAEEKKPEKPVVPEEPVKPVVSITDIDGHWASNNIIKLVQAGAIEGYSDNSFRPDNNISRAEFVTALVKALKLEPVDGKAFNDTANHWAKDYISIANAYGIIAGFNDSRFGPDDLITREQMAIMIIKAVDLNQKLNERTFVDNSSISNWAKEAIDIASGNNIIAGYPDGTFKPQNNASRAEAVSVIAKVL